MPLQKGGNTYRTLSFIFARGENISFYEGDDYMILTIIKVCCFLACMAMANKVIHKKVNERGNGVIRKINNK